MNTDTTQSTFKRLATTEIASLDLRCEEYQHTLTGARHIHLAADNKENVFLVALRTVPTDSSGVAHILEHTSLCGSKKYPVRDPFFMMIRRSLNTFMNAFTSSDWTAYPFASQSRKDFDNLLTVYLDAVFFARLDPLDFAQEGHRVEFEKSDDASSDLVYKGVVFNEMKGAMSSISSQLWQAVGENLFPDNTYQYNSGGEPAVIPQLSYEQLQSFYKKHYHPDNAVFFTYGDIPACEHQQKFEALALQHFSSEKTVIEVPLQAPFDKPISNTKAYPLAEGEAASKNCHRVMAWVLDDIRDPMAVMAAHLLSSILLEDSASPLQQALETTELGSSPSPLCGLDDSGLQMVFVCGLEGCEESGQDDFEALVLDALQNTITQGVEQNRLVALLDQLELQQREISGDSHPYGLQLILSCLATALHRGEPASMLNIDPVLEQLRKDIESPNFITALIKRVLLDNPHRVTVTLTPDAHLNQQLITEETDRLAAIKATLSEDEKQAIIATSQALTERQAAVDDPGVLPKVGLDDVPAMAAPPTFNPLDCGGRKLAYYPQGTNGLTYHQVICSLPPLSEAQLSILSLHNRVLTEVGVGDYDYLQTQSWQTGVCGGINAYSSIRGEIDNEQQVQGYFTLSAKGLAARGSDIDKLLASTWNDARFDEHQRIAELIARYTARAEQSVTGNGHALAMSAACQGMSPIAKLGHNSSGLRGIQKLKALNKSLVEPSAQADFSARLAELHQLLSHSEHQFLAVGEADQQEQTVDALIQNWPAQSITKSARLELPATRQQSRQLWICNSQVNFCAKAYPTVPVGHADAASLTVLAGVLRNGFLHTAIREQGGAYGGGASQDSMNAAFRFYSYRDPRLSDTLDDFDQSIAWVLETQHEWRVIEEAILGVVSSLDKPSSPAGTAKQHFHDALFGRSPAQHARFRQEVLGVTAADLIRVAEQYLKPEQASIGIVTHSGEAAQYESLCERDGIEIITL